MFGKLVILFTVIPILELLILIELGGHIGVLNTILLIFITGVVGAALAKSEGRQILMEIQKEMSFGRMPGDALISGLSVLLGGAMLITPGVFTDVVGFFLVIPFTRIFLIKLIKSQIKSMIKEGNVNVYYGNSFHGKKDSHNSPFNDVEDVEDVDYEEIDKE